MTVLSDADFENYGAPAGKSPQVLSHQEFENFGAPQQPQGAGAPASGWDMLTGRQPGQVMPDVGPAPFLSEQAAEEVSPGLPAVNRKAEQWSESANRNLIAPFAHPIDTATNIGRLALGVGQYLGLPGDQFKQDVDELIKEKGRVYGSWNEFAKTASEDPFQILMDASLLASPLGAARRAATKSPRVAVPTTDELFDAANGHYKAMHGFGVEVKPEVLDDVATNATTALKADGFYPGIAPKTFGMIDELRNPDGPTFTTQQIEAIRRGLNKVSGDATDRAAARQVIDLLDNTMAGLQPKDAVVNGHYAPRVAQEGVAARGNYAAAKRAEQIDEAVSNADLQAASTGSGGNANNALRQKLRQIVTNKKLRRGYSKEELAAMEQVVRGTRGGNLARLVGKLAPTGVVSTALSTGLGMAAGMPWYVAPAVGMAAKRIGDLSTTRGTARLGEQVRMRSPGARAIGAAMAPPVAPRAARNATSLAMKLNLLGRMPEEQ